MKLLDGKVVKREMLERLKNELLSLEDKVHLVVIQIGNDEASNVYIEQKRKMAINVGLVFDHIKLKEDVTSEDVIELISKFNEDEKVTGIMVQMPIPRTLDKFRIENSIVPQKDVDGLTAYNAGLLVHDNKDAIIPCTAKGIITLLDYYGVEIEGKHAVVVGRSDLVGKPIEALLLKKNATVTMCHSKTEDLSFYTRQADILVVAVGKPNLIRGCDVKDGAVVVDVGINRLADCLCGDVCFEEVKNKASYITPVPGGVGQLTVAELGNNTYKAYKLQKKMD